MQINRIVYAFILSILVLTGCAASPKEGAPAKVTGTITYMQRIALPPEAVVLIRLEDVSKQDVMAEQIGKQVIENPGQVPIPFEIEYDSSLIDPRHSYAIQARIMVGSELWFLNTGTYYVITQENPLANVEVLVDLVK